LACDEFGNKYLGVIKYDEFYDKQGSYTSEEGPHSTELVDYLVSHNFVISAFCLLPEILILHTESVR
jgi:hypothetical protein